MRCKEELLHFILQKKLHLYSGECSLSMLKK